MGALVTNRFFRKTLFLNFLLLLMLCDLPLFSQQHKSSGNVLQAAGDQIVDSIPLRPGWNWISFPRLERLANDPVPSVQVVEDRIYSFPYNFAQLRFLPPTAPEPSEEYEVFIQYTLDEGIWQLHDLFNVYSTDGYKIYVDPKDVEHHLLLKGTVLAPVTGKTLLAGKDNWTGYFLPETQSPIHAIGDQLNKLKSIKAHDWAAYNMGTEAKPEWVSSIQKPLRYGDMLVLTPFSDVTDFQWTRLGSPFDDPALPQAQYFSYTERADYTALFLAIDTTDLPLEIGVFAGDLCVGACQPDAADSLAFIKAYIPAGVDDTLSFAYYDPLKKGRGRRISQYQVYDEKSRALVKRPIRTREGGGFYFVSLKSSDTGSDSNGTTKPAGLQLEAYPNPVHDRLELTYRLPADGPVMIELMNQYGSAIATLVRTWQKQGSYSFTHSIKSGQPATASGGVYFVKLSAGGSVVVKKLIVY